MMVKPRSMFHTFLMFHIPTSNFGAQYCKNELEIIATILTNILAMGWNVYISVFCSSSLPAKTVDQQRLLFTGTDEEEGFVRVLASIDSLSRETAVLTTLGIIHVTSRWANTEGFLNDKFPWRTPAIKPSFSGLCPGQANEQMSMACWSTPWLFSLH